MQPTESALRQYLQILRRRAWLVALVPALTLGLVLTLIATNEQEYNASMTMVVGEQPRLGFPPELGSGSITRTLTNLLEGDLVARKVMTKLDLGGSLTDFHKKLKVEVLPDTAVLKLTYKTTDREEGLDVLSELARTFTQRLDETLGLQAGRPRAASFRLVVRVFDEPHVDPVETSTTTTIGFAIVAGLVLGIMLAIGRAAVDSRMRSRRDAEQWFGAPVVGALPKGMRGKTPPGIGGPRRHENRRVASLDLLRARLQFAGMGVAGPTILVTSATAGEGKSTVAANLGAALAWTGERVVCVDADVRRASLQRYLGIETEGPGLTEVLNGEVVLEDALLTVELVQPTSNGQGPTDAPGRLEVLPAGSKPHTLGSVLTPEIVTALLERLRARADYIVFDSPPLLVADSYPLALQADNVLIVARSGRTTREQAESVRATLAGLGVQKVGVVLTDSRSADGYGYSG
jgi:Mrp family chromosome partitioning ATPase/capsular polysaccharide biosynthesis protein